MLVNAAEKRAAFADLYRAGDLDHALALAAEQLISSAGDERLRWGNNEALALWRLGRSADALRSLASVSAEATDTADHLLAGNYNNNTALASMSLWFESEDEERLDSALIGFEGAAFHYRLCEERALVASALNNVGVILSALGRYAEAYVKLDEARAIYLKVGESCRAAEVDETEARARLMAGESDRALVLAARSVSVLADFGDGALAEAEETLKAVLAAREATR